MNNQNCLSTTCCVVGGGPAGLLLGYLLARGGVDVTVVEKHADFLHDFRGDTLPPSTMEIINQLGLLDELLTLPHQRVSRMQATIGGKSVTIADFSRLPVKCPFLAFMPQWDFLNFIAEKALSIGHFRLLRCCEVESLISQNGVVTGIRARQDDKILTIDAVLVVGADGRHSRVREEGKFTGRSFGAPRDVLWFKLSKRPEDHDIETGHQGSRQGFIVIDRDDYWQCGLLIEKGPFTSLIDQGIVHFRSLLTTIAPFSAERYQEIGDWSQIKLLSIRIDRLDEWAKPGVLCIGDAAHAMSPIGGVGVNLAIQDAVATANLLTRPLLSGAVSLSQLKKVQQRRQFPTAATQFLQIKMSRKKRRPPSARPSAMAKVIRKLPFLPFLFGRLIGMGFRTERPAHFLTGGDSH
ncbi:MAG: 6-methylpretetramide 4-monooxygenase [Candidatus Erwinia impunctatus]|nr:6-methylpretetramide 4-monooxygenase [Culicoides impunctatus]